MCSIKFSHIRSKMIRAVFCVWSEISPSHFVIKLQFFYSWYCWNWPASHWPYCRKPEFCLFVTCVLCFVGPPICNRWVKTDYFKNLRTFGPPCASILLNSNNQLERSNIILPDFTNRRRRRRRTKSTTTTIMTITTTTSITTTAAAAATADEPVELGVTACGRFDWFDVIWLDVISPTNDSNSVGQPFFSIAFAWMYTYEGRSKSFATSI